MSDPTWQKSYKVFYRLGTENEKPFVGWNLPPAPQERNLDVPKEIVAEWILQLLAMTHHQASVFNLKKWEEEILEKVNDRVSEH